MGTSVCLAQMRLQSQEATREVGVVTLTIDSSADGCEHLNGILEALQVVFKMIQHIQKRLLASSSLDTHPHYFAPGLPFSAPSEVCRKVGRGRVGRRQPLRARAFWPLSVHILFSSQSPRC